MREANGSSCDDGLTDGLLARLFDHLHAGLCRAQKLPGARALVSAMKRRGTMIRTIDKLAASCDHTHRLTLEWLVQWYGARTDEMLESIRACGGCCCDCEVAVNLCMFSNTGNLDLHHCASAAPLTSGRGHGDCGRISPMPGKRMAVVCRNCHVSHAAG